MRVFSPYALVTILAMSACADAGASLAIDDARASRLADGRVAVEFDVLAKERGGGNVGTYCSRVTFTGQARVLEECRADLEDGDLKTLRFTSDGPIAANAAITLDLRLDHLGTWRSLAAPGP